jgi:hypothetical protein
MPDLKNEPTDFVFAGLTIIIGITTSAATAVFGEAVNSRSNGFTNVPGRLSFIAARAMYFRSFVFQFVGKYIIVYVYGIADETPDDSDTKQENHGRGNNNVPSYGGRYRCGLYKSPPIPKPAIAPKIAAIPGYRS